MADSIRYNTGGTMKRIFVCLTFLVLILSALHAKGKDEIKLHHNPWELIIYRPENTEQMTPVRCWLKIEDMDGNDVTYTAAKATYEWTSIPDRINYYQKSWWLEGGVAMHLNLKKGRYRFSVNTPPEKQYPYPSRNRSEWTSNQFIYDTENPAKVIFVYPTADDNGFYNGGWIISSKAPEFYKFTKPNMQNSMN